MTEEQNGVLIDLFSQPLGVTKLGRDLTEEELNFILGLEKTNNVLNKYTTNKYVLEEEPLKDLKEVIEERVDAYFRSVYAADPEVSMDIKNSWVNFTERGEAHQRHSHPNSIISGVLFVQVDEEKHDSLIFYNSGRVHSWQFTEEKVTKYTMHQFDLLVQNATLALFPSYLEHEVPGTASDNTRVTLSFNTFFKGSMGSDEHVTRLVV